MGWITFRYKNTPSVPIILKGNNGYRVTVGCIVDSGSTVSFLPLDFAEALDLDLSSEPAECDGMNGKFKSIETSVNVEIRKMRKKFKLPIHVFVNRKTDFAVVGREGFFSTFDVKILHSEGKVLLKEASPHTSKYNKKVKARYR